MPQADLEVVGVVGGSHFDATGTKFHFRIGIGDHGNGLIQQGQDHVLSDNRAVALILGVDADTGVTQHGFRTGGGDDDLAGAVFQGIADMPQMAGLIHIFHFRVTKGGHTVGAPVDDPAALVNQALLIQGDKHLPHGLGAALIHGEPGTVPITAGTQLLLLLHDPVAEAVLPVPNPLQELLPAQVVTGQAFLPQLFLDLDLSGNAGVVYTGDPKGVIALHPLEANDAVLQGRVHCVAHMQLSGDIGRGHDDGKGLFVLIPLRVEVTTLLPHVVNLGLNGLGLIDLV